MRHDGSSQGYPWLLLLVAVVVVAAHVVALRSLWTRLALPAFVVLFALVVAKHLGLFALMRTRWRRSR